ncbi:hypothetical protein DPEC_G00248290 [Dallia pectoralis]|uniref:Uncharacterized protein n=1 Tax=Dallia pectoralis TaxID=75939 RepID=A0ACC2FWM2_DALPE|nr:hypothetical protein DPEC_G00248290 [Dallia pectoralis]
MFNARSRDKTGTLQNSRLPSASSSQATTTPSSFPPLLHRRLKVQGMEGPRPAAGHLSSGLPDFDQRGLQTRNYLRGATEFAGRETRMASIERPRREG